MIKLKQLENKFKIVQEGMEIIEKEIEKPPLEFLETGSAKDKMTSSKEIIEEERGTKTMYLRCNVSLAWSVIYPTVYLLNTEGDA